MKLTCDAASRETTLTTCSSSRCRKANTRSEIYRNLQKSIDISSNADDNRESTASRKMCLIFCKFLKISRHAISWFVYRRGSVRTSYVQLDGEVAARRMDQLHALLHEDAPASHRRRRTQTQRVGSFIYTIIKTTSVGDATVSTSQEQTLNGRGARVYTCTCVHDHILWRRLPKQVDRRIPIHHKSSAGMPGQEEPAHRGWLGVVTGIRLIISSSSNSWEIRGLSSSQW